MRAALGAVVEPPLAQACPVSVSVLMTLSSVEAPVEAAMAVARLAISRTARQTALTALQLLFVTASEVQMAPPVYVMNLLRSGAARVSGVRTVTQMGINICGQ